MQKVKQPEPTNVTAIMAFAGSWSEMGEADFTDFLQETRNIRNGCI